MKTRAPYVIIFALLSLILLLSLLLNAGSYWQVYGIGGWRDEVFGLVGVKAARQALDDFRDGHLRLYSLGGESDKARYTGTNDGPFEVWTPWFHPSLGRAHRYSTEQFIQFYNGKMRYMYAHPDKFRRQAEKTQNGATNGRQPVPSEPNRTSSAAGSRR